MSFRLIGKKKQQRNELLHSALPLTHSVPPPPPPLTQLFLFLCLSLALPACFSPRRPPDLSRHGIFIATPVQRHRNRHTNPRLNIAWYSLQAFLSLRPPPNPPFTALSGGSHLPFDPLPPRPFFSCLLRDEGEEPLNDSSIETLLF